MRAVSLLKILGPRSIAALSALVIGALSSTARAASPLGALGLGDGSAPSAVTFRLPWESGASQYLTQDANDACCSDHVGANKYAFDFALPAGGAFDVVAPAAGTIVHVKMSSSSGCAEPSCVSDANYVVIDHGDGTQTTMLHLAQGSLDPFLTCGSFVRRGDHLARTGSTGWSTGVHLHVERDQVKKDLRKTCECGPDGMGCPSSTVEWNLFWPSPSQPNLPMDFEEWQNASTSPDNRRGLIGPSRNMVLDEGMFNYVETQGRFSTVEGEWKLAPEGGHQGALQYAAATASSAALSLKSVVSEAGLYAVWAYVPLAAQVPGSLADLSFEVKGAANTTLGKGTLTMGPGVASGAFHPVRGLERVKLSGGKTESLVVTASGETDGKLIVLDAFILHRVLDDVANAKKPKALPIPNWRPSSLQIGLAMNEAKGGGLRDTPTEAQGSSFGHGLFALVSVAGFALLAVITQRAWRE